METFEDPPTYNRTNKFTKGFQALIDSYGVASYREMNPTPYTIITFPFLFAVMFGDLGHGLIMFLFAGWMVLKEKPLAAQKSTNEIWNIFFAGRYIIFLMGMFSMYTGLIYNDVFSKSLNIFGSHWELNKNITKELILNNKVINLDPSHDYTNTPYPIGVDPIWQLANNKIVFLNSYKMKVAIIIGIVHMLFGIFVGLFNHLYFKRKLNITCEFIPQVLFLTLLFFYLSLLMFIKWIKYGPLNPIYNPDPKTGPNCAPAVLITFINMVLFKPPDKKPENPQHPDPCSPWMYAGQNQIQSLFVIVAVACIPWMMFGKPYLLMQERKKKHVQVRFFYDLIFYITIKQISSYRYLNLLFNFSIGQCYLFAGKKKKKRMYVLPLKYLVVS